MKTEDFTAMDIALCETATSFSLFCIKPLCCSHEFFACVFRFVAREPFECFRNTLISTKHYITNCFFNDMLVVAVMGVYTIAKEVLRFAILFTHTYTPHYPLMTNKEL